MANNFSKFEDVFKALLEAPDKEARDERVRFEQMMVADFIGTLNNVRNSETREEGDALLESAMIGDFEKFADELGSIKDAAVEEEEKKSIDEMIAMLDYAGTVAGNAFVAGKLAGKHNRFADELTGIKNASKRVEGNKDIDALMTLMIDYASALASIKSAATLEAGNEIIKACMA